MNQLFDFFLDPYRTASAVDIILEVLAVSFGIASVWYAKKERVLVYPTGIISTAIYIYVCFVEVLYGDLIVNIYYTLMSIYGWYMWTRITHNKHIEITRTSKADKLKALGIFVFTAIFVVEVYRRYSVIPWHLSFTEIFEYAYDNLTSGDLETFRLKGAIFLDVITTGIFFAAMWLMANKKIEHWILWIVGNIISVPLYFVKGLGLTGIQFTIFLILAYLGYKSWKKSLDSPQSIS